MYGVYIFDRDREEIKKVAATVNWSEYGFKIVGSNTDAVIAESEIMSLKPMLVMLGTERPQSQGIHFVRAVREVGVDCRIVVLVTWWNTNAMGTFFNNGGFDYLLKPLDREWVVKVLSRFPRGTQSEQTNAAVKH